MPLLLLCRTHLDWFVVVDRVEWPCLERTVMAGVNAIAPANMALAGYDKVIPLEETLSAMREVGDLMHSKLRCTGLGGLSVTPTSKKIYDELKQNKTKVIIYKKQNILGVVSYE